MSTLATLLVKLGLDSSGFKSGLQQVAQETQSRAVSLRGVLASVASIPGAATALRFVASGVHELGDALIGGNAQFETYQTQFESLLHSASDAKALIGNLATFAAVTPFELPGVIQASKNLLTFGGTALNTMDNLRIFGNAAAATSSDFGEVTFWAGRAYAAIQAGKPFGEATMRLTEMGVMTAKTSQKLDDLAKAKAPPAAMWDAFKNGLQAPSDAMDKLSMTWSGLISTLHDTLSGLGRTIGLPIFTAAKSMLLPFLNFLMGAQVQGAATRIANGIAKILLGLGVAFQVIGRRATPILKIMVDDFVFLRDALLTFAQALAGDWIPDPGKVLPFHEILGELGLIIRSIVIPAFNDLVALWERISGPVETAALAIGRLLLIGSPLVRIAYDIYNAWQQVAAGFAQGGIKGAIDALIVAMEKLGPVDIILGGIIGFLEDLVTTIVNVGSALANGDFSGAWSAFTNGISIAWNNIEATGITLFDWFSTAGTKLAGFIDTWGPPILQAVSTALTTAINWIGTNAPLAGAQLVTWGTEFANWVPGAITNLLNALPGIYNTTVQWIGDQVDPIVTKLGVWATAFIDWIVPAIPGFMQAVGAFVVGLGTVLAEGVGVIALKAADWAVALTEWLTTTVPGLIAAGWALLTIQMGQLADGSKAKLQEAGTATAQSYNNGLSIGWAALPVVIAVAMDVITREMLKGGINFNKTAGIIAKGWIDAFFNFWQTDAPGQIALAGLNLAGWILTWQARLALGAAQIGIGIAKAIATALMDTWTTYKTQIINAIAAVGIWAVDALITAGATARHAATKLGQAIVDGVSSGLFDFARLIGDKINSGIDQAMAFVHLKQKIQSPSKVWAAEVGIPLTTGVALGAATGASAMATSIAGSVGNALDKAKKTIAPKTKALVADTSQAFIDSAQKIVDFIKNGTDALSGLATFKAPTTKNFTDFFSSAETAVSDAISISKNFKVKAVEAGATFADGAVKILGLVSTGADALAKLVTFKAPSTANIDNFFMAIEVAIGVALSIAKQFKPKLVEAGATFADSATKILALIGTGADALEALLKYKPITIASLTDFFGNVMDAVSNAVEIAKQFKPKLVQLGADFADSAGKILALIGSGADALTKLTDYKPITIAALTDFFGNVMDAVSFAIEIGRQFKPKLVEAGATFADGAGKIVALIGTGATALQSLNRFKAPSIAVLTSFFTTVAESVKNMATASKGTSQDLVDAAGLWAEGAGKVLGIFTGAVQAFDAIRKYTGIAPAVFRLFASDLDGVVATMVIIAQKYQTDGLAAATAFGNAVGAVMAGLKSALDTFKELADYKSIPQGVTQTFISDMYGVIGTLQGFFTSIGTTLDNADVWQTSMEAVAGTIKAAVDALGSIRDYKGILPDAAALLVSDMQVVNDALVTMASLAAVTAVNAVTWLGLIIDTVSRIRQGGAAISALDGLNIHASVTMTIDETTQASSARGQLGRPGPNWSFQGARALGGAVQRGLSYLVGENGPERFVPDQPGTIIANDFSAGGSGRTFVNERPVESNTYHSYEINMNGPVHNKEEARDGLVDAMRAAGIQVNG